MFAGKNCQMWYGIKGLGGYGHIVPWMVVILIVGWMTSLKVGMAKNPKGFPSINSYKQLESRKFKV
jgi:hypothetical protein